MILSLTARFVVLLGLILWTNPTLLPTTQETFRKDEFDLHYGPWGIVCGASEGIGLEWVYALAERGVNVVMIGRDAAKLNAARAEVQRIHAYSQFLAVELDLGNVDALRKISVEFAKLDVGILVYNAAYSPVGSFASYGTEMHERTVNVNVLTPTILISALVPKMIQKKKGAVILMSSVDGEGCSPFVTNYSGTKAWATRMAEGLWFELRPHGIDVLGVVAGLTTTTSLSKVLDPQKRKDLLSLMESSPRNVVIESLRALGKGHPVVITGLGSKLVTWMRWFLPRSVECTLMSAMEHVLRPEEERQTAARAMMTEALKAEL